MNIIEKYEHVGEGYNPFLVGPKWQIAQLNYSVEESLERKNRLDVHNLTDEAFLLIEGEAVLVAALIIHDEISYDIKRMKPGEVYNIPKKVWHNIVLTQGAKVMIMEDANTHLPLPEGDYEFFYFSAWQKEVFVQKVKNEFNNKN